MRLVTGGIMAKSFTRRVGMNCPHCQHPAVVRTSARLTAVFREMTYQCKNILCGHVFVCALEVIRTLSPSAIPNPEISLPLSKNVRRRELVSQLQLAEAAPA